MGRKSRAKRERRLRKQAGSLEIVTTPGSGRVSDALVDIAQPLLAQQPSTIEMTIRILTFAQLVWNATIAGSQLSKLPAMLATKTGLSEDVCTDMVVPLARRKVARYLDDNRHIVGIEVEERKDGKLRVVAASMRSQ